MLRRCLYSSNLRAATLYQPRLFPFSIIRKVAQDSRVPPKPLATQPQTRSSRTPAVTRVDVSAKSDADAQLPIETSPPEPENQQPPPEPRLSLIARPISFLPFSPTLRGLCLFILTSFLMFHIITKHIVSINHCEGVSMLPTLNMYGDFVLLSKYYRRGRGVAVGDVISFRHPAEEGVDAVKRVLGLEGDFVLMGTPPATDADSGANREGELASGKMIQVPQGHCWVVGDNLKFSRDSRLFGPLPMALINGKVIARVGPWSERKWLRNPITHALTEEDDDVD